MSYQSLSPITNALVTAYGTVTNPNLTTASGTGDTFFNNTPVAKPGTINTVMFTTTSTAQIIIIQARQISGNTYATVNSYTVPSPIAGVNSANPNFQVLAGDLIGIYYGSNNAYFSNSPFVGGTFFLLAGQLPGGAGALLSSFPGTIAIYFEVQDAQTPTKEANAATLSITPTNYITVGNTASGASTATAGITYLNTKDFLKIGILQTVQVYCTVSGAASIVILRGGGVWLWQKLVVNFTAVVGLNTVNIGNFPVTDIDRVAFYSSNGGAQLGYSAVSNYPYNTLSIIPVTAAQQFVSSSGAQLCIAANIITNPVINANISGPAQFYQETFSKPLNSQWINASTWTPSYTGLTSTTTGLANAIILNNQYNLQQRITRVGLTMTSNFVGGIVVNVKESQNVSEGTIAFVDAGNSVINIYETWNSSATLPAVRTSATIPTVVAGRAYVMELEKSYKVNRFRWIDTVTGTITEICAETTASDTTTGASTNQVYGGGRQCDTVGLCFYAGTTATFTSIQMTAPSLQPLLYIGGDSITEGYGVDEGLTYAELLAKQLGYNNVAVSARGGSTIVGILEKMNTEVAFLKPTYVMITIGSNGGNTSANLAQLIDLIYYYGARPIINCIPMMSAGGEGGNTLILTFGVPSLRFDIATATNNDPTGSQNASLFLSDLLHPTNAGHAAAALRFPIDLPFLFRQSQTFNSQNAVVPIMSSYIVAEYYTDQGNTSTTETDLYTQTLPGSILHYNGDKLHAEYAGTFVNSASTKQLKVYFAGTVIFDSTALSTLAAASWRVTVDIIRDSYTTVRATVTLIDMATGTLAEAKYTALTGLSFQTNYILKITGTAAGAGAATNDVVASMGLIRFQSRIA